jgi:hypothetical protein
MEKPCQETWGFHGTLLGYDGFLSFFKPTIMGRSLKIIGYDSVYKPTLG